MTYTIKRLNSYQLQLTVTLEKPDLDFYTSEARKFLANDLKIKGFRKGKAPPNLADNHLDKNKILETAFDFAFKQSLADVLLKEKIELLDIGNFKVKENSSGKLIYTILLTTIPEFKIPDYQKINIKKREITVSQDEVAKVIEFIRRSRAKNGVLPELNDEFAKNLGKFNSFKELEKSVSDGLREEKKQRESQRVRAEILNKISEKTKIEIPEILINRQLDKMINDFDLTLHQEGKELSLWLAKAGKTQDDLRKDWRAKAIDLIKKALILKKIAELENIKVEEKELNLAINQVLGNFSNIDQIKEIDLKKLSEELNQLLLQEKILAFLETKLS